MKDESNVEGHRKPGQTRRALMLMGGGGLLSGVLRCRPHETETETETEVDYQELRMKTFWPKDPDLRVLKEAADRFANDLRIMTDDKYRVIIEHADEGDSAPMIWRDLRRGRYDMVYGTAYYWKNIDGLEGAQLFTSMPFGFNTQQMNTWLYNGGGLELWQQLYKDHGVFPLPFGNTGITMGGWFREELSSIGSFKGLKMRIPGLGEEVLKKAGAEPNPALSSDIISACESGELDAVEWIGPYDDFQLGLHEHFDYYYYPGWHETCACLELAFNLGTYNNLPNGIKKLITILTRQIHQWVLLRYETRNSEYLFKLKERDVEIVRFDREIIAALRGYSREVLDDLQRRDAFSSEVIRSMDRFRQLSAEWVGYSEKAYYDDIYE